MMKMMKRMEEEECEGGVEVSILPLQTVYTVVAVCGVIAVSIYLLVRVWYRGQGQSDKEA
jgi:hypothetical protein